MELATFADVPLTKVRILVSSKFLELDFGESCRKIDCGNKSKRKANDHNDNAAKDK